MIPSRFHGRDSLPVDADNLPVVHIEGQKIKPRLRVGPIGHGWHCIGIGYTGAGSSPREAYRNWAAGILNRFRLTLGTT